MHSQSQGSTPQEWIEGKIRVGGPVPVAKFMEWALYHPTWGYYTAGPNIGPRGDFTTSPEASPAFGRLLARHVADVDNLLDHPDTFSLIEYGPGKGTLALHILETLRVGYSDLYARLRYSLVEISPALAATQKEMLARDHGAVTSWYTESGQVRAGGHGAVIANELVDAFPVHVIENRGGELVEQFVDIAPSGGLRVTYLPPSTPRLRNFVDRYSIHLEPGQRIEINLAQEAWTRELSVLLERGVATIIDYGDTQPARYSQPRREGTMLGYYAGTVTDNILDHPGEQDLTALVDFTALEDAARAAGLTTLGITRQAHMLLGLGLGTVERPENHSTDLPEVLEYRRGLQALTSMEGLGKFHVLLLGKGVDKESAVEQLSCLKYAGLI
ncbi:MAG: SAM-dependent methyltransferase [Chloroflexota bacterium]|nr:SAM-dependent methyltransferase [Chloroflexota bacterium]